MDPQSTPNPGLQRLFTLMTQVVAPARQDLENLLALDPRPTEEEAEAIIRNAFSLRGFPLEDEEVYSFLEEYRAQGRIAPSPGAASC